VLVVQCNLLKIHCLGSFKPAAALFDLVRIAGQVGAYDIERFGRRVRVLALFCQIVQDKGISQIPVVVKAAGVLEHFNVCRRDEVIRGWCAQDGAQVERHGEAVDHANRLRNVQQHAVHVKNDRVYLGAHLFNIGCG